MMALLGKMLAIRFHKLTVENYKTVGLFKTFA